MLAVFNSSDQDVLSIPGLLYIKSKLDIKYGPPLKAIKISQETLALIALTHSEFPAFLGVLIEIDDSLGLWEFKEIYA
jgi:hypothetical protein